MEPPRNRCLCLARHLARGRSSVLVGDRSLPQRRGCDPGRQNSFRSSHWRELGGLNDLALLMLDVAGFRAFLSIGDPVGIGLERVAPSPPRALTPEAPEEDNLVDCPDIGGEDADRLAEMPDVDRHA